MDDLYDKVLVKETVPVALRTTTVTGAAVDRGEDNSEYQSAMFVIHTGTLTDGTYTCDVQDSDASGSGFASIDSSLLRGSAPAIAATDDNKVFEVGYLGGKRYLRLVVTAAGTTTGGTFGATVILGDPRVSPVIRN